MDKNKKPYLPNQRGYMDEKPKTIESYSNNKESKTTLPDPIKDPIVSMNISFNEFDYTQELFEDEDPISPPDKNNN